MIRHVGRLCSLGSYELADRSRLAAAPGTRSHRRTDASANAASGAMMLDHTVGVSRSAETAVTFQRPALSDRASVAHEALRGATASVMGAPSHAREHSCSEVAPRRPQAVVRCDAGARRSAPTARDLPRPARLRASLRSPASPRQGSTRTISLMRRFCAPILSIASLPRVDKARLLRRTMTGTGKIRSPFDRQHPELRCTSLRHPARSLRNYVNA